MKEKHITLCREIEAHLNDTMESNAKKLLDRDQVIQNEMDLFENTLSSDQLQHWHIIREQVDNMRRYAKLGKIRLMDGDENVSKLLSEYQTKLEDPGTDIDIYDQAAIEITREMHEPSGIAGIFKSLFMWKDTPEERVQEKMED